MRTEAGGLRRARPGRWSRAVEGAVTVVAFTESGRMHRVRVSRRLLVAAGLLLAVLLVGSTTSVLRLFREQVDLARMTYLEQENKSLTSLLEGQAEQLSRLKLEVARLKEFEQNLRVVSGMDTQTDPAAGAAPERADKKGAPRKR
jgi:multidrug resistance efflux pump